MALDRPDNLAENSSIFTSLMGGISQMINRLHQHRVFSATIEVFVLQIIPALKQSFESHPEDENKAAEEFILGVVNEYFYYRSWPQTGGRKFIQSGNDLHLKTAASLTLFLMESLHPEILRSSTEFQKINQGFLQSEKKRYLQRFNES